MVLINNILESAARSGPQPLLDWALSHPLASDSTLKSAMSNPNCPDEMVRKALSHRLASVRSAALLRTPSPEDIDDLLAAEKSVTVLRAAFFAQVGSEKMWSSHPRLRDAVTNNWSEPRVTDTAKHFPGLLWDLSDTINPDLLYQVLVEETTWDTEAKLWLPGRGHATYQQQIRRLIADAWNDGVHTMAATNVMNVDYESCAAALARFAFGHVLEERLAPGSDAHREAIRELLPLLEPAMMWTGSDRDICPAWWASWSDVATEWLRSGRPCSNVAALLFHRGTYILTDLTYDDKIEVFIEFMCHLAPPNDERLDQDQHWRLWRLWRLFDTRTYDYSNDGEQIRRQVFADVDRRIGDRAERFMSALVQSSVEHALFSVSGPALSGRADGLLPYMTPELLDGSPDGSLAAAIWLSSLPADLQQAAESLMTSSPAAPLWKIHEMAQAVAA